MPTPPVSSPPDPSRGVLTPVLLVLALCATGMAILIAGAPR